MVEKRSYKSTYTTKGGKKKDGVFSREEEWHDPNTEEGQRALVDFFNELPTAEQLNDSRIQDMENIAMRVFEQSGADYSAGLEVKPEPLTQIEAANTLRGTIGGYRSSIERKNWFEAIRFAMQAVDALHKVTLFGMDKNISEGQSYLSNQVKAGIGEPQNEKHNQWQKWYREAAEKCPEFAKLKYKEEKGEYLKDKHAITEEVDTIKRKMISKK